jgi:hypothetical protein
MRPSDDRPAELVGRAPTRAVPLDPDGLDDTAAVARAGVAQVVAARESPPAELAGMLLPTESVTFASSPHPIVFVRPVAGLIVVAIALGSVLAWQTHPIVRGHHVIVPLLTGIARTAVMLAGGLLLLRELFSLMKRLFHFLAYRVVTTNRRVFVVTGLLGRHVTPLGNTALAGATMSQGLLGRMFGFGSVLLSTGSIEDVRDPVRLYREFEAVANGVEGDTWKQPVRQTIIP